MSLFRFGFSLLVSLMPAMVFAAEEAAPANAQQGGFGPIIFLVAILAFMYLLVWRPQQKKAKEHRALVSAVAVDDEILMSSGIVAKVTATDAQYITVNVGDNINIIVQRSAIAAVLPKGTLDSLKKK